MATWRAGIVSSAVLALFWGAPPAHAQEPYIAHVACDTVSTNPLVRRHHFDVVNPTFANIGTISMIPSADSCIAVSCNAPAGWVCAPDAGTSAANFFSSSNCVPPTDRLGGFSISITSDSCCFLVVYLTCILEEGLGAESVCFDCDTPVQAVGRTWGRVKALYR